MFGNYVTGVRDRCAISPTFTEKNSSIRAKTECDIWAGTVIITNKLVFAIFSNTNSGVGNVGNTVPIAIETLRIWKSVCKTEIITPTRATVVPASSLGVVQGAN